MNPLIWMQFTLVEDSQPILVLLSDIVAFESRRSEYQAGTISTGSYTVINLREDKQCFYVQETTQQIAIALMSGPISQFVTSVSGV